MSYYAVTEWKYYIECELLTIEVPLNNQRHLFDQITERIIIESRGLNLHDGDTIDNQTKRIASVFRLSRMAYEVSKTCKISNISFEDAKELYKLGVDLNEKLIMILNKFKFGLTHEPKDYSILADQTAKNLNSVLTG